MLAVLSFLLSLPFMAVGKLASFIVWDILSTGEWRKRRPGVNPAIILQGQVDYLHHELVEAQRAHKAHVDELEQHHRKELQQLRSRL